MSQVLSKKLAKLLRHDADLMSGGYVFVDNVLSRSEFSQWTEADVKLVVETSDKQRFALATEHGRLKIKATQGHSKSFDDPTLEEIRDYRAYPCVIHGTTYCAWKSIESQGIHRRSRQHIHFAPGEPSDSAVISGMPKTTRVKIYIDLKKALRDGIKFYKSTNNVILSPGDKNGAIKPQYFQKVTDSRTGEALEIASDMSNLHL